MPNALPPNLRWSNVLQRTRSEKEGVGPAVSAPQRKFSLVTTCPPPERTALYLLTRLYVVLCKFWPPSGLSSHAQGARMTASFNQSGSLRRPWAFPPALLPNRASGPRFSLVHDSKWRLHAHPKSTFPNRNRSWRTVPGSPSRKSSTRWMRPTSNASSA